MKERLSATATDSGRPDGSSRAHLRLAHDSPRAADAAREEGPHTHTLGRLATLLATHAPHDGVFELRLPGLYVVRRSRPTRQLERATVFPTVCIVAQGAKTVMLGRALFAAAATQGGRSMP